MKDTFDKALCIYRAGKGTRLPKVRSNKIAWISIQAKWLQSQHEKWQQVGRIDKAK
ncbi:hypothetical protein E2542_SST04803 [Spatholobus suberectus]|nr:hypothetical protein E2542_SST04803 [Spatholobus suberectus]